MKQFISPPERTDWSLDPEWFARTLHATWPDVEVCIIGEPESNHSVEWTTYRQGRRLSGSLDRAGQVVALDGHLEDCAAIARWFRSLVPSQQKLIFYDEGYSADMELTGDTSEEQLVAPFLARR